MKISSGVSTALMSAMLAMNGRCVSSIEGIVSEDVDQTIHNLTLIGKEAMVETDRQVLEIMTHKWEMGLIALKNLRTEPTLFFKEQGYLS